MDCPNTQALLGAYLDQEVEPRQRVEIDEHLKGCARCAQAYDEDQAIQRSLKTGQFYFKAPADLQNKIRSSLRQAARAESPSRWFSLSWIKLAAPLAAAALVVLLVVPYFAGPSADERLTQEVVAGHIRSLMVNHLADVASSDEHTVKPWFNGKLDFSPPVNDPAKQGFPLVGGRLDYLDNRPVAALVYRREKHVINVFVWPAEKDTKAEAPTITRQGYHVMHWTQSGMNFWVVSDLEQKQLVKFTELLQSADAAASS